MAQQGQQFRSQQGINPQQVAMLQQMAQARGQQGGQNPQWTPQQLQMAMSEMQAQGGNVNTQALIQAAMRASGGQVMTPTPQGNRTPDQMGQTGGGGQDAHGQAQAMQQQRMQHLMQQQGGAPSPQQREAMQGRTATPSISASTRPSQQPSQQSGNMPPPPKPGSGIQNGQINYSQPQPAANQQLSLTPQQQQFFAAQRAQMIANPQFQQLQPQQQHQQLAFMTQHMIRTFAQQNAPGQQQQQQQQQQQRQQQQQLQYSQANAQPFPGGSGQQQHLQQAAGQPLSSLPQHMAPPRPASAASQRAPSSHDSSPSMYHTASTPPQPIYPTATPQHQSMPSLTTSTHSHQSHQHQTPRQQSIPPPNSSSPVSQPHTSQRGQPPQAIGVNGTLSQQPNAKAPFALQAMQQHAQNAQTMLQSGQLTGPPQVDAQNVAAQKQQQVASSIGFMTGTAGNQAVMLNAGQGMPPRPPMPNINMSDFPFDWRLLPQISHLNDPKWQSEVQQRNPQLLAAVQSAAAMLNSGSVRQDVLQRMQQVLFHAARSQAAARPPQQVGQVSQQVQQQLAATGMPGYSQNGQLSQQQIQALPPAQQQRLWAMQQAQGYGGGRPPPPHLPPSLLPESPSNGTVPSAARRLSISNDAMPRERTPSHASMPPPAWIPSHGFARPPPHTAPDAPSSHSPSPHAVPVKLWESALRLDLPITNISPLPTNDIDESADSTFGGLLMPMSDQEKEQVQEWLQRDKGFAKEMEDHKRKMQKKWMKWAQNNDMDTPWWQVRKGEQYRQPVGRLSIIWPSDKANLRARSTHRGRKEFRL
jgi:SWI/SNF-related matrix-associated actin-dependent regulator of chromatin subfamily B protein 1